MKTFLLLFLIPLFAGFTVAVSESRLTWSETRPLKWADFRGVPDENSFGSALTAVKIAAIPYRDRGRLNYRITAYFLPEYSWCKHKSARLLNHEQGHFDIAEVYARKARSKVRQLQARGIKDYRIYNKAIQLILEESNIEDRRYDRETLNGISASRQVIWDRKIGALLRQYETN